MKPNDKAFEAALARLAPVDDEALVKIASKALHEKHGGPNDETYHAIVRCTLAAIRPHIEAAALSDIVEFSKRKNWELAYRTPFYSGDPDQKEYWVVWERAGIDQDHKWDAIGKGETAAEAIAAAIRSGK